MSAREDRRDRRRLKPRSNPYKKHHFDANRYLQRPLAQSEKTTKDDMLDEEELIQWEDGT